MGRYRYGVELYSVKNELEKDMPATLQRVKDMGYEAVEFFGPFKHPAKEVKQDLEDQTEHLNSDPYGAWIVKVRPADVSELDSLMDAAAYEAYVHEAEEGGH